MTADYADRVIPADAVLHDNADGSITYVDERGVTHYCEIGAAIALLRERGELPPMDRE